MATAILYLITFYNMALKEAANQRASIHESRVQLESVCRGLAA